MCGIVGLFLKDSSLQPQMGERLCEFTPAYLKLKHQEWNAFTAHLTQWERDNTLDG